MSLVNICPDIPDNWKGGVLAVSKVLGLSDQTIRRACALGKYNGGIDFKIEMNGRKVFSGKEVKRFWRSH